MRAMRMLRALAAAAVVGGLALTGCSSDTEPDAEHTINPLAPYQRALWGDEAEGAEQERQEFMRREELTATCMKELGWTYTPRQPDESMYQAPADPDGQWPEDGSLEFAKQFGYGIVAWPGKDEEVVEEDDDQPEDPNLAYENSLTETELAAYNQALFGQQGEMEVLDEDGNLTEPDRGPQGCASKSWDAVAKDQPSKDPEFVELIELMSALFELEQDPKLIEELDGEWAECMSGRGYAFSTRSEATMHISDQLQALTEPLWENNDWEANPDGPDESQLKDELAVIQAEEIKQATDDFLCSDEVGYDKRLDEANYEREQKFVDEHKAQLDALMAKYGEPTK